MGEVRYDYFAKPSNDDAWTPKISGWQRRERADEAPVLGDTEGGVGVAADAQAGERDPEAAAEEGLRTKYFEFRAARKRAVARELTQWIQSEAKKHYVPDGPIDHWATLEETLRGNGDDCDGLELLTFHALRDLGFAPSEVYRSIVYRPSDGQHHMVTLWFEDEGDPWVIDPTGAMSPGMRKMSQVPGWVPLKVFSESIEYTVKRGNRAASTTLATNP